MDIANLEEIEQLAIRVKSGDQQALVILEKKFEPLIYKISKQVHLRFGRIFPIEEVINQSKFALTHATIIQYQPGGKAHYPYFIKKAIHAYLVQLYRPIYTLAKKSVPIERCTTTINPLDELCQCERVEICQHMMEYVDQNCNEREKDIIYTYICGDTSRKQLALKYHVSIIRIKHIHKTLIKKLKKYLSRFGVNTIEDI